MDAHHLTYETELPARPAQASRRHAIARRTLDFVLAFVALVALLPLFLLIAVFVWADSPGPVVFRQRRLGRGLKPFTMCKFRTMDINANEEPHREYVRTLIGGNHSSPRHGRSKLYKLAVDDRLTRVGVVLRRLSLDELPQLWNVVRGHMSLVGPRPVIPYEVEHYPGWYTERFAVKPGITGLWQVSGRNERTYEEMVRFDVEYVQRESLRLYLAILLKTVWVVVRRQGAA
jgi:lipopolysaccharide/colanic/teichoic acid biosynthesis glycosyltransferase